MTAGLSGARVGFIERSHPTGNRGSLVDELVPLLRAGGARVDVVHAEIGAHRLDQPVEWDVAVLKSGSAAALHLAAASEGWGTPSVNTSAATRLAQDKLASSAILQAAGLPIAPANLAWLGPNCPALLQLDGLASRPLIVKAARGSRGQGLWKVKPGGLPKLASDLPEGPYLLMEWLPHDGNDLKVFVAGDWMTAIERPFPAATLAQKRGRPVGLPADVADAAREAGRLLGLTCYGCDFVRTARGWMLVDCNAFPGYKGAAGASAAIAAVIACSARERQG